MVTGTHFRGGPARRGRRSGMPGCVLGLGAASGDPVCAEVTAEAGGRGGDRATQSAEEAGPAFPSGRAARGSVPAASGSHPRRGGAQVPAHRDPPAALARERVRDGAPPLGGAGPRPAPRAETASSSRQWPGPMSPRPLKARSAPGPPTGGGVRFGPPSRGGVTLAWRPATHRPSQPPPPPPPAHRATIRARPPSGRRHPPCRRGVASP